jgi:hypothetical protein
MRGQESGDPFSVTTTHATGAVASKTGATGKTYYITDISASSDKAGSIILVKQGTTTIWQDLVGAGAYARSFSTPLVGASGALVSVEIDGTSACKANISGYAL